MPLLIKIIICFLGPVMSLCGNNHTESEDCNNASSGHTSSVILFLANAALGIGTSMYYTLGIAYMDDNARKIKTPMLFGKYFNFQLSQ
jgi:hypothetical protein